MLEFEGDKPSKEREQSAGDENEVEPAVIEAKVNVAQQFRDDGAVLQGQRHAHQEHGGHKVHALHVTHHQCDPNRTVVRRVLVKDLHQLLQEAAYRGGDHDADHAERDRLRPELHVNVHVEQAECDAQSERDWIVLDDAIEHDVDRCLILVSTGPKVVVAHLP